MGPATKLRAVPPPPGIRTRGSGVSVSRAHKDEAGEPEVYEEGNLQEYLRGVFNEEKEEG